MSRMPPCQVEGRARHCKTLQACGRSGKAFLVSFEGIVQLVRTPACHAGGRRFESRRPAIFPREDSIPATWLVLSTGEQTPETPHASSRKGWEERRRHLRREFLEYTHGPRDVTIAKMDHPEMEDGEVPSRHDLDEPPVAQQFRLHQRRKVANAGARQQRGRKASVVVHREERPERQCLLFLSVRLSEVPAILGRPKRERE